VNKEQVQKAVSDVEKALNPPDPAPESELARLRRKFCPPEPGKLKHLWLKRHREDEGYDSVTLEIVERYKTSGMSGDEWRFSTVVKVWWKGLLIGKRSYWKMENAVRYIDSWMTIDQELMLDDTDRKIRWPTEEDRAKYCFQPGCRELAVSTYRIKTEYGPQGEDLAERDFDLGPKVRRFCKKHLRRGDCDKEDCDDNYEVLEGPGPGEADFRDANITESGFGGVINI